MLILILCKVVFCNMDTLDLNKLLQHNSAFMGTFPRDLLPPPVKCKSQPLGLIANTDVARDPGTHWVAIYVDASSRGEYFDSFGLAPQYNEITSFLNQVCKRGWSYNSYALQDITGDTCGVYAAMYLETRFQGYTYQHFMSLFTDNPRINDFLVPWIYLIGLSE